MTTIETIGVLLLSIVGIPLMVYITAQAWTYGTLLAKHRFWQKFEESKNGDQEG